MGGLFLSGEDGVAHFLEMSLGFWAVVVVWGSAPEGLFIQLDLFGVGLAVYHGTEVGVAYGQSLQPMTGWLTVP